MQMISCLLSFDRTPAVTVHGQAFSELKMPYDTVVVTDFADLECEASAKSVAVCATREQYPPALEMKDVAVRKLYGMVFL